MATELDRYVAFMTASTGDPALAELGVLAQRAAAGLPDQLPVGLVHHDFVARNVFVDEGGVVTVFDPMITARSAVYEDIGRFLVGLDISGLQLATRGLAVPERIVRQWRRQFLDGYFGGGVPEREVRLFEVIVLLDRWAAVIDWSSRRHGVARHRGMMRWFHGYFRSRLTARLDPLSGGAQR